MANENVFFTSQLVDADNAKSSDPVLFNEIISELVLIRNTASLSQQYYLDYLIGYKQAYEGKLDLSIKSFEKILKSNANYEIKFRVNSTIINILAIKQEWTKGLKYLSDNLNLLKKVSNEEVRDNGLIASAIFYNLLGQYKLGLQYSSTVQASTSNARTFCAASQLALEAKFKLETIETNDENINLAIEACEAVDEVVMTSAIRAYLASLYIDKNNITQAKSILLETLADIKSTQYAPVIAKYYALLSKLYFLDNNLSDSEYYAKKAIDKAIGAGNSKPIIIAYYYLYKIYKNLNSDKKALSYYIKYSEAQNAHLKGEKAKNLAFQLAEHKSLEQETQIKLLNEKNNALAAEQALAKTQATNKKLIILSLTLIIFVLAFFGLRFYHAHKRVKELAEYDPLTGIFNRGHFTHVAESALKYCKNARQDLSLIIFDLDHFKKVNDSFGHGCGDWALKETIKVCKEIGRKNDIFARLGGEEFCIVLPGCNIEAARLHAEACRAAIEAIDTEESTHKFNITASFGVTDVKLSGFNLDVLLANADMAAYASKNSGRNLVTLHQAS